jgi:hypothetical protein
VKILTILEGRKQGAEECAEELAFEKGGSVRGEDRGFLFLYRVIPPFFKKKTRSYFCGVFVWTVSFGKNPFGKYRPSCPGRLLVMEKKSFGKNPFGKNILRRKEILIFSAMLSF